MAEFDPTQRELCPDGACIGVIGKDGRCKECGTVGASATTHSRYRGMDLPADANDDDDDAGDHDDRELCPDDLCVGVIGTNGRCNECGTPAGGATPEPAPGPESPGTGDDDGDDSNDRELCPDGMCIGIIGSNGRCKECGTAAHSGSS